MDRTELMNEGSRRYGSLKNEYVHGRCDGCDMKVATTEYDKDGRKYLLCEQCLDKAEMKNDTDSAWKDPKHKSTSEQHEE